MAERLFYPLWDAGLELGHGARTVEECLTVAAESFDLETSFLQSRLLVGDQDLFRRLLDRLRELVTDGGGRPFVERLLDSRDTRREDSGPAGALLEPDLKEGRGGLRDVHEVLWAAAALRGVAGVDGLAGTGWLDTARTAELEAALDVLLAARTSLHYIAGRKVDRLLLDYQEDVAALAGDGGPRAVEEVMGRVFSAAQAVSFVAEDAWGRYPARCGTARPGRAAPAARPPRDRRRPAGPAHRTAAGGVGGPRPAGTPLARRYPLRLVAGLGVHPLPGPAGQPPYVHGRRAQLPLRGQRSGDSPAGGATTRWPAP